MNISHRLTEKPRRGRQPENIHWKKAKKCTQLWERWGTHDLSTEFLKSHPLRSTWRGTQILSLGVYVSAIKRSRSPATDTAPAVWQTHPQKESHELCTPQLCNAYPIGHTWSALFLKQQISSTPTKAPVVLSHHRPQTERILGQGKNVTELDTSMHQVVHPYRVSKCPFLSMIYFPPSNISDNLKHFAD